MAAPTTYDNLREICARRRSVRSFDERPLSPGEIAGIREIAAYSPYASGKKNWELKVLTDREEILALAEIVRTACRDIEGRVRDDFREWFRDYADNFSLFASAPALFIPVFRVQPSLSTMTDGPVEGIARWERDTFVKSISCVAMLVLLAAESLGLKGCYMTGPLIAGPELAERLGLRNGYEIGAVIPVGHPKGDR